MKSPYFPYSGYLQSKFRAPVRKITVDAGFSCPNRDGTLSQEGSFYCDNAAFSPAVEHRGVSIAGQVQRALQVFKGPSDTRFLAYFQPFTNTYAPPEKLRQLYHEALCGERIVGIVIGTRPDCVDKGVVEVLKELKSKTDVTLELGVQTSNDDTLKRINRGHDFSAVVKAAALCRDAGVEFGFHVILGLPGEGRDEVCRTAEDLALLGHSTVKIHHFHVCKSTPYEKEYREGKIAVPELAFHAAATVDFLERTPGSVAIARLMGDCLRDSLVAPDWSLNKQAAIKAIEAEFANRKTQQGVLTELPYLLQE